MVANTRVRYEGKLQAQEWSFWFDDRATVLRLDSYVYQTRLTTRHKFRNADVWNRIQSRQNTLQKPPIPDGVLLEALQKFRDGITVSGEING